MAKKELLVRWRSKQAYQYEGVTYEREINDEDVLDQTTAKSYQRSGLVDIIGLPEDHIPKIDGEVYIIDDALPVVKKHEGHPIGTDYAHGS